MNLQCCSKHMEAWVVRVVVMMVLVSIIMVSEDDMIDGVLILVAAI